MKSGMEFSTSDILLTLKVFAHCSLHGSELGLNLLLEESLGQQKIDELLTLQ